MAACGCCGDGCCWEEETCWSFINWLLWLLYLKWGYRHSDIKTLVCEQALMLKCFKLHQTTWARLSFVLAAQQYGVVLFRFGSLITFMVCICHSFSTIFSFTTNTEASIALLHATMPAAVRSVGRLMGSKRLIVACTPQWSE